MTDKREVMPIMVGVFIKAIPWAVISSHERQADLNHGQTLNRLAERGGLDPAEAVAIIKDQPWPSHQSPKVIAACERYLMRLSARTPEAARGKAP